MDGARRSPAVRGRAVAILAALSVTLCVLLCLMLAVQAAPRDDACGCARQDTVAAPNWTGRLPGILPAQDGNKRAPG